MRLLLDTHAVVWAILADRRLSETARSAMENSQTAVLVSLASVWEIAIKVGRGKWPEANAVLNEFETHLEKLSFVLLPMTAQHVRAAGLMQAPHRDPFDRLLAAQATIEGLTLVTADTNLQMLVPDWLW